jgi:hypothetical protein
LADNGYALWAAIKESFGFASSNAGRSREQQTVVPQSPQAILTAGLQHSNEPPFCIHAPPPRRAMFMRAGETLSCHASGEFRTGTLTR